MLTNQGFATEATSWKLVLQTLPCSIRRNLWHVDQSGLSLRSHKLEACATLLQAGSLCYNASVFHARECVADKKSWHLIVGNNESP